MLLFCVLCTFPLFLQLYWEDALSVFNSYLFPFPCISSTPLKDLYFYVGIVVFLIFLVVWMIFPLNSLSHVAFILVCVWSKNLSCLLFGITMCGWMVLVFHCDPVISAVPKVMCIGLQVCFQELHTDVMVSSRVLCNNSYRGIHTYKLPYTHRHTYHSLTGTLRWHISLLTVSYILYNLFLWVFHSAESCCVLLCHLLFKDITMGLFSSVLWFDAAPVFVLETDYCGFPLLLTLLLPPEICTWAFKFFSKAIM